MEDVETCNRCLRRVPIIYCDWTRTQIGGVLLCIDCALIAHNRYIGVPDNTPFGNDVTDRVWKEYQEYKKNK